LAGILRVDTLQSDSNLALKIATANVAFIDSNGLNVVGGNLTIGATQFAEGGQIQTAGIADDAITSDKILSVANTKISGVIEVSQLADTLNLASKTVTLPAGVGGKVLQVVSAVKTDTASTSSTTFSDILTLNITPSSASSKILLLASTNIGVNDAGLRAMTRLVRDSTAIFIGDAAGSRVRVSWQGGGFSVQTTQSVNHSFLDSPATTSAITYKFQFNSETNDGQYIVYVNRSSTDSDATGYGRGASSLIAMEIAA
jgi:hypothetical protein